ncbi:MAG TPA: hypothetical protein ENK93_02440 [Campylobacteraceae bacterium]|nr:hypothetical protein [Campylobacteraceae bacterium]HHD83713.1 hypothetical protein [Campylobacteraceae bacterium]
MKKILLILFLFFAFVLHADTQSIMLHKGKKIAQLMCDDKRLKTAHFDSPEDAKRAILSQKLCRPLTPEKLEAVAQWISSLKNTDTNPKSIDVPKDAKCPICGMFVAKYPKWATMMQDSNGKKRYFDGVKDMMKYYFNHKDERFDPIRVQDFYTLKSIDARRAWYVTGSNVYGPMGRELIPFASREDAEIFKKEHFGKKIIRFDEIREEDLYEGE